MPPPAYTALTVSLCNVATQDRFTQRFIDAYPGTVTAVNLFRCAVIYTVYVSSLWWATGMRGVPLKIVGGFFLATTAVDLLFLAHWAVFGRTRGPFDVE